jgi:rare lipoprotein A
VRRALAFLLLGGVVTGCATAPESVEPPAPAEPRAEVERQRGTAVYYASRFHGRRTASGVPLDNRAMVAAHPSLPFGCVVTVTNQRNGKAVAVKVIDRGPSPSGQRRGIVIDVSQGAARELGFFRQGSTEVELEIPGSCLTSS